MDKAPTPIVDAAEIDALTLDIPGQQTTDKVVRSFIARDIERRLSALQADARWIPVGERLPEDGTEVLIAVESVFEPHYHIWKAYHVSHIPQWTADNGLYYHHTSNYESVTHWMPLPEAPKEDE